MKLLLRLSREAVRYKNLYIVAILATLGLFVFLWHWNDFLWPLVIAQDHDMRVLTTGISSLMREDQPLNVQLAAACVALLPIFLAYLFAQRYFTQGVTMSGMKG